MALGLPKQEYVASLGTYTVSGANSITWAPGYKATIKRVIFIFTTANATAKNTLTLQTRPVAGTAANEVALGTIELPAVSALGSVYYHEPSRLFGNTSTGVDGSAVVAGGTGGVQVEQAGDFRITSDGGGDNGICNVYVEFEREPFSDPVGSANVVRVDRVT